jgi:hypothetical protein
MIPQSFFFVFFFKLSNFHFWRIVAFNVLLPLFWVGILGRVPLGETRILGNKEMGIEDGCSLHTLFFETMLDIGHQMGK